jgi:hypothetical protein
VTAGHAENIWKNEKAVLLSDDAVRGTLSRLEPPDQNAVNGRERPRSQSNGHRHRCESTIVLPQPLADTHFRKAA